jgi:hypothetical protein
MSTTRIEHRGIDALSSNARAGVRVRAVSRVRRMRLRTSCTRLRKIAENAQSAGAIAGSEATGYSLSQHRRSARTDSEARAPASCTLASRELSMCRSRATSEVARIFLGVSVFPESRSVVSSQV